jgi:hypothetical protein
MHSTETVWWPPTPSEAPTLDDVIGTLQDLLERGSEAYRRDQDIYRQEAREEWESLDQLQARLKDDPAALQLLFLYETRNNYLSALWARDQFRVGFALGAAGRLYAAD